MDHPDINYLKQDKIGKVIAQGLAILYRDQPKFPVDYLAKWLLNYSASQENEQNIQKRLKEKEQIIQQYNQKLQQEQEEKMKREHAIQADLKIDEDFRNQIRYHQYHEELLYRDFPNFLQQRKKLTGAYVAILDYPFKQIDENDDEENAHIDKEQQKLIKYIGYCDDHKKILENQQISIETGVTGEVFKEKQQEELDENGENKQNDKNNYVYVPNVIYEPKMHYFRIPKLGSYLAIPIIYNSYLNEVSFDQALIDRIEYLKKVDEETQRREQEQQQFEDELNQKKDAGEDTTEFQQNWLQIKSEWQDIPQPEFTYQKKEYVLCLDTLGQDLEIDEENKKYFEEFAKLFAQSWQECERLNLQNDIQSQIQYLQSLNNNPREYIENIQQEEDRYIEENPEKLEHVSKENEKQWNYEIDNLRLEKVIQNLKQNDIQEMIKILPQFRIIKYSSLLQSILYFLGYKKQEINIPNINNLNWKVVQNLINDEFLNKILSYNHRGEKRDKVEQYAMLNRLTRRIERYNLEEIENYNIGLGRLFKWFQLTLKQRKLDIELRREQIERLKQERQQKIEQHQIWLEERERALEQHKNDLSPDDLETFDPQDFLRDYDEDHQRVEIPDEVMDEFDGDLEDE